MLSQHTIDDFLAQRHIALVGMSRNPKHFTRVVADRLRAGGRTVYPVNPVTEEVGGERCYRSLADVPEPLDGVLVMVDASRAKDVVDDCVARGVTRVWLHRGTGRGSSSPEAVERCHEAGIAVVDGACVLMFTDPVAWYHRVHHLVVKRHIAA
jgi:uncharacterized protein